MVEHRPLGLISRRSNHRDLLPLILLLQLAVIAPAAADDEPLIIFNMKNFTDTGDMVHVEGTLTGDGIGYKNNRSALTWLELTKCSPDTHKEIRQRFQCDVGKQVVCVSLAKRP
jgi:hypothetical protein